MKRPAGDPYFFAQWVFALVISVVWLVGTAQAAADPRDDSRDAERRRMVETQIAGRGVTDQRVLYAILKVPRHEFVPAQLSDRAYGDYPLPIGYGQTISQPYIVALMTELLDLQGSEKVLEIGTGSGYQAAVLGETAGEVYTMEIVKALQEPAAELLKKTGYEKVHCKFGDGYDGWEEHAPFDGIMVTAACDHIPPPLIKQLKEGGVMVIPLGPASATQLLRRARKVDGKLQFDFSLPVRFVPLTRAAR